MTKYLLLFYLMLVSQLLFAATPDSTQFAGQKNPWIDILDLSYNNVETVEIAVTERISEGTNSKLFVYTENDGVRFFRMYTPNKNSKRKRTIKEKSISIKKQDYYIQLLEDARTKNFMNIKAEQLNITSDGQRFVRVSSGKTYRFRYIGYDYFKDFMTYAPKRYIQNRLPGWQERDKMLELFSLFHKEMKW